MSRTCTLDLCLVCLRKGARAARPLARVGVVVPVVRVVGVAFAIGRLGRRAGASAAVAVVIASALAAVNARSDALRLELLEPARLLFAVRERAAANARRLLFLAVGAALGVLRRLKTTLELLALTPRLTAFLTFSNDLLSLKHSHRCKASAILIIAHKIITKAVVIPLLL